MTTNGLGRGWSVQLFDNLVFFYIARLDSEEKEHWFQGVKRSVCTICGIHTNTWVILHKVSSTAVDSVAVWLCVKSPFLVCVVADVSTAAGCTKYVA